MAKHNSSVLTADSVPQMTIGLDLSDRVAHYCAIGRDGNVCGRGQITLTRAAVRKHFSDIAGCRIALEACGQSAWIEEVLSDLGHEVIVANPRELHAITRSCRKSDPRDAEQLARLARVDPALLHPVRQRSAERRLDLIIIRSRAQLIECRTKLVNHVRGMAKGFGERVPAASTGNFAQRAMAALSPALNAALRLVLEQIIRLSESIVECDEQIAELSRKYTSEVQWLEGVGSVGTLTATTFVLTLDQADRFAHSRDVGAYLGFVPKRSQSGERDPQLGISKAGNKYLRKLLVQCAQQMLGRYGASCALREWGLQRAAAGRTSKKRIIVAVARKLAVLLHRLWKNREVYRPFPAIEQPQCA